MVWTAPLRARCRCGRRPHHHRNWRGRMIWSSTLASVSADPDLRIFNAFLFLFHEVIDGLDRVGLDAEVAAKWMVQRRDQKNCQAEKQ
jgi:hypothetical protein